MLRPEVCFAFFSEQKGTRPAIVIFKKLPGDIFIIIPLTSKKKEWWSVVKIEKEEGLKETSFALCHQLRAVSKERIKKYIGKISFDTLNKIKTVLAEILGL